MSLCLTWFLIRRNFNPKISSVKQVDFFKNDLERMAFDTCEVKKHTLCNNSRYKVD